MTSSFSVKVRYNVFPQDSGVDSSFVASAVGVVTWHCNPEPCFNNMVFAQNLSEVMHLVIRIQDH